MFFCELRWVYKLTVRKNSLFCIFSFFINLNSIQTYVSSVRWRRVAEVHDFNKESFCNIKMQLLRNCLDVAPSQQLMSMSYIHIYSQIFRENCKVNATVCTSEWGMSEEQEMVNLEWNWSGVIREIAAVTIKIIKIGHCVYVFHMQSKRLLFSSCWKCRVNTGSAIGELLHLLRKCLCQKQAKVALAATCAFGSNLDETLCDRLVENVANHHIRERLLLKTDLTLSKASQLLLKLRQLVNKLKPYQARIWCLCKRYVESLWQLFFSV